LKQIFGDEIEREKELLIKDKEQREASAQQARPEVEQEGDVGVEHEEEILELEEVGGRALTDSSMKHDDNGAHGNGGPGNGNGTSPGRPGRSMELRLKLSSGELEALQKIADAHKTTVDQVARELLRSHLKWR
jgi:hypothetical protein